MSIDLMNISLAFSNALVQIRILQTLGAIDPETAALPLIKRIWVLYECHGWDDELSEEG